MHSLEARKCYHDAWNRLYSTLQARNSLLRQIDSMAVPAISITMATNMIVQFDTDLARQLLNDVDDLAPRISEGMAEVNRFAEAAELPKLHWQNHVMTRWER